MIGCRFFRLKYPTNPLFTLFPIYPILNLPQVEPPNWSALTITIIGARSRSHVIMSSPHPSPRRNHLKVARSVSNLRLPSAASTTGSSSAYNTEVLASSSSSMNNVDMNDRILVPEPEADVEAVVEQQNAVGQMDATASDEERKESLRAKLRNTLSKKQSFPGTSRSRWGAPLVTTSRLKKLIGLIF